MGAPVGALEVPAAVFQPRTGDQDWTYIGRVTFVKLVVFPAAPLMPAGCLASHER